jgi:hypothetical protein
MKTLPAFTDGPCGGIVWAAADPSTAIHAPAAAASE